MSNAVFFPAVITMVWGLWIIRGLVRPRRCDTIADLLEGGFSGLLAVLTVIPILTMWIIWLAWRLYAGG